jgi:transposase-like protein
MGVISATSKRFCPFCGSSHILKSHARGVIEQLLLRLIDVHHYRCSDCDKRFYGYSGRKVSADGSLLRDRAH